VIVVQLSRYRGIVEPLLSVYVFAGALIGAYFVSEQLPYVGPSIYYNSIPQSTTEFVDKSSYLRSIGLGFLDVRPSRVSALFSDRLGKPILDLDHLLLKIVKTKNKFDWDKFESKQRDNQQTLKVWRLVIGSNIGQGNDGCTSDIGIRSANETASSIQLPRRQLSVPRRNVSVLESEHADPGRYWRSCSTEGSS
jgi:hypothetical protein